MVISRSFSESLMNSKNTVSEQKALPFRTPQERMYISVGVFLTLPFTFIHLADALLRHFFMVYFEDTSAKKMSAISEGTILGTS